MLVCTSLPMIMGTVYIEGIHTLYDLNRNNYRKSTRGTQVHLQLLCYKKIYHKTYYISVARVPDKSNASMIKWRNTFVMDNVKLSITFKYRCYTK